MAQIPVPAKLDLWSVSPTVTEVVYVTCTQIKDILRFADDRAAEQGSFHGQQEHMVCHIHSILLLVVVRPPVLSRSVGVIASAIFEDIVLH